MNRVGPTNVDGGDVVLVDRLHWHDAALHTPTLKLRQQGLPLISRVCAFGSRILESLRPLRAIEPTQFP